MVIRKKINTFAQLKAIKPIIESVKQRSKPIDKLRRYVLLAMLAIIMIILALSFRVCYHAVKAETHVRYVGMMNVAAEKIAKTIRGMEMNAKNVFDEVEKHMNSPESVIEALESKTSLNPDVRGYFAAFEPNYFEQKGRWFEPYVHHVDSSEFFVRQVGSARHDYTKSDWYVHAKEYGKSFWSDPYYYYDGTSISGHYCTFVKPIYDTAGQLVCVCGADMTFEWLAKELERIDEDSKKDDMLNRFRMFRDLEFYTVVLNKDGGCIAYPEEKCVPIKDNSIIRDLKEKKSGIVDMEIKGVASTVYYCPIEYIDWSVAVVVPKQGTQKPLLLLGLVLLSVAVIGMIVVWLICRRIRYAETAEIHL